MDTFSANVAARPTPTDRAAVVGSVMYDVDPSGFGISPEVSCMHRTAARHLSDSQYFTLPPLVRADSAWTPFGLSSDSDLS